MNCFDLHCDTVTAAYKRKADLTNEKLHINIEKASCFEKHIQCFALWLDDSVHGLEACNEAQKLYEYYQKQDFHNIRPVLTLENAVSLGERLENLALWKSRGVFSISLTWNGANELGFGADIQSGGLTQFGFDALHEMENLGIVVDVSHINEDGFCDIAKTAKLPFIASHSNCFALCPHKRNLKDYQLSEIISRGGLVGINFYPAFLPDGDVFEAVYKNICHILSLGGEKCIALGSDFDGAKMSKKLSDISKVPALYDFLIKKGLDLRFLEDIFFKNAENFYNKVLHNQ